MRRALIALMLAAIVVGACILLTAGMLSAPAQRSIGNPPADLRAEAVTFSSLSGSEIHGWFIAGRTGRGAVILMHGVRADRRSMIDRTRFLSRDGFAVLLFDFQAHGESRGDKISFGYLEARDAAAAVQFVRTRLPGEHVAAIGSSLGGAAALMGDKPLGVDGLVLEAVYPTLERAIANRLAIRLGAHGASMLSPFLLWQVKPRLGFDPGIVSPLAGIAKARCPLLLIAGSEDRRTSLAESERLFDAATTQKELWVVDGAAHVDFHRFAKAEYERRVVEFLERSFARP